MYPVSVPRHLPRTAVSSLGLLAEKWDPVQELTLVVLPIQRGVLTPEAWLGARPTVTRPLYTRFSDAVCLVVLLLSKLSSAACLSSRSPSACVLCVLEAFTRSHVQDSSLVMCAPCEGHTEACASHVAFSSWFCPQKHRALNTVVQKQTCTLVLCGDLQAGLAGTDIYLSVYLKEFWFKFFSLNLLYLFCVCVLFYFIWEVNQYWPNGLTIFSVQRMKCLSKNMKVLRRAEG